MEELQGANESVPGTYAIVVARYNEMITGKLLKGALDTLHAHGVTDEQIVVAHVPGAWELPVTAQQLAARDDTVAVICIGAVIKGETTHDEYINRQVSDGLGRLALEHQLPVIFGVLTCNSMEQAFNRAGGRVGNKGEECAMAALEMAHLMKQLRD